MSRLTPLLLLCACGAGPTGEIALTLLSPLDGDVVCGDPLVVSTEVENFELTNDLDESVGDHVGHLHVFLNGQEVIQGGAETVEVNDIPGGEYQLRVELALANHDALDPYVGSTVYITVDDTLCSE